MYSQLGKSPNALCSLGILLPVLSHDRLMEMGFPRAVKQMSKMQQRTVTSSAFCVSCYRWILAQFQIRMKETMSI